MERLDRHAGQCRRKNLFEVVQRQLRDRLAVAGKYGLERFDIFELRLFLYHCRNTVEAVDHLGIDWMLDPERAVLIKSGDAILRRHEFRASLISGSTHEVDDRLFRRAFIPRGERRVLRRFRLGWKGKQWCGQRWQQDEG